MRSLTPHTDFRALIGFMAPHRATLALGLVLGLAATSASLALPLVTKRLLDSLGTGQPLAPSVVLLIALLLVGAILGFIQWVMLGNLAERVVLRARTSLVRLFFGAKLPALQRHSTGELVTRVTSDTVLLREATSSSIIEIINSVIMLVGTLVFMAVLDPTLLAVTVVVLTVVGVVVGLLLPRVGRAHREAQRALGQLGGTLEGGLRAVRTVKANRAELREVERVELAARASAKHSALAVRGEALIWTIGTNGAYLAVILVLAVGAWRVDAGVLQVSSLVAFLLYAFGIVEPVTELSVQLGELQAGATAARRLRDIEQLPMETLQPSVTGSVTGSVTKSVGSPASAATVPTPRPLPQTNAPLITLRDVSVMHPGADKPALQKVSLTLPRRGRVAVVGPSGAGKTSLFGVLLHFTPPTSGVVTLDGLDQADMDPADIRRRYAYVEQESPLVSGTVRENLLLPDPKVSEDEVWAALTQVCLAERVRSLPQGLDTRLLDSMLSGGERQRVALARAVLHAPDALLLDEATAQLDGITEAAVHDVLETLAKERLVVSIAHRMSTVIDSDLILVLEEGRVRASGTHNELVHKDDLYRGLITAMRVSDVAM